jgi:hypothetical protein
VTICSKLSVDNDILEVYEGLRILAGKSLFFGDQNYSHGLPNCPKNKYGLFCTFGQSEHLAGLQSDANQKEKIASYYDE